METLSVLLVIGSTPFMIEPENLQLRQFNKQDNVIAFDSLTQQKGYYSATFDTSRHKVIVKEKKFGEHHADTIDVVLPSQILHSPNSLTDDQVSDLNLLSKGKELGFFLADRDTALRLSGVLLNIDLAGTDFTIDWRLKELRETEFPWKNISLRDMEMSDNGEEYLCFYHIDTHELYIPGEDLFELPQNVVLLEIPNEIKLDPVAVAREFGIGETDLLPDHPFQMNIAARVTPLSETGLSAFIAEYIKRRDHLTADDSLVRRRGR
ncbi:hypothetical protein CKK33_18925 [Mucilaginibacter sp. MD40]|uniref:hypothetical protein n=1 Tax=Mucilaginibacter sp. MD40 TaxID=2029590 RepID=UPI000BAC6F81|nr:hypothetical protein [Mucilaginibacter sp. MD40]PAW95461.1 hypothetical protein CKK33_18925 [Mucilaginibacter sp. MD40]